MKKRLLSMLIVLCMVLALLQVSVLAADVVRKGFCGNEDHPEDIAWTLYSDGLLTISGRGAMYDCGDYSEFYRMRDSIRSVVIEPGVSRICSYAFPYCTRMTSITIPNSVGVISAFAFVGCTGLTSVSVPCSLGGEPAFAFCTSIERFTMRGGSEIGWGALSDCTSLKVISLPASLKSVDQYAFSGAKALTDVYYEGTQEQWDAVSIESNGNDPLLNAEIHFGGTPLAIVVGPQDVSAREGDQVSFSVLTTKDADYQWQYSTDNGMTWESTESASDHLTFTAEAACDGRLYRCMVTCGAETVYSDPAKLTVYSGPILISQPQDAAANAGEGAAFSVAAEGSNLTYQWQYSADNGKTWKNSAASSGTAATLSFTAKAAYNGRLYRCAVSDGTYTVYSDTATLTVMAELAINTHPKSATVSAGTEATFSVRATGINLTYQWQYSTDNGKTWMDSAASSAKKATLSFTAKIADNGRLYRCAVSDGTTTAYSHVARLMVTTGPVVTTQPNPVTVFAGETAKFSVRATGTNLTYQWQWSKDGENWTNSTSSSARKATLTITAKASFNGRLYRCAVSDGVTTVYSNAAKLTVAVPLRITTQPQDFVSVAAGKKATMSVAATGTGLTYQWQWSRDGEHWTNSTASSARKAKLSITAKASFDGRLYRCVVTDVTGSEAITDYTFLSVS